MAELPKPLTEEELKKLAESQRESKDVDPLTDMTPAEAALLMSTIFEQKTGRRADVFSSNGITSVGFGPYLENAALHAQVENELNEKPSLPGGGFPAPGVTSKTVLTAPSPPKEPDKTPKRLTDEEILKRDPKKQRQWIAAKIGGKTALANKILAEMRQAAS